MRVSLLWLLLVTTVAAAGENIDPANDGSQYAWGENAGWLNAEPTADGGPGVEVGNFALSGWMWGENTGWISLSCDNTSICGASSYRVVQDSFGVLSGFAWAENSGWIDFRPANGGVTIDPATGDFSGYAWGENIGWISFNCANTGTCGTASFKVKTSWTCTAAQPAGSPSLTLARSGGGTVLDWTTLPAVGRYDVVRGSLGALKSSGGNFTLATEQCLADNQAANTLTYAGNPAVGAGYWFLVRGVNCAGAATYDSGSPTQLGSRDAEINASAGACP